MLSVILFSAAYIDLACFRQLPCAIIYIYVEKNPSIKVHRVADPLFFFFSKSKFNFSSVSSSLVLCLSAVAGCSSLLSRVKPLAKG